MSMHDDMPDADRVVDTTNGRATLIDTVAEAMTAAPGDAAAMATGGGCHAGADTMRAAAEKAGAAPLLDQLAEDYPLGPHDKPQSMCPRSDRSVSVFG